MPHTETDTITAIEKVVGLNGWSDAIDPATWVGLAHQTALEVAPLWPLENFVASNPYLGVTSQHFDEAGVRLALTGFGDVLMSPDYFAQALTDNDVDDAQVQTAAKALGGGFEQLTVEELARELKRTRNDLESPFKTIADFAGDAIEKDVAALITESISSWAASYFDTGQALWPSPWRDLEPFAAWREEASRNRKPEIHGIPNARQFIGSLPDTPEGLLRLAAELVPMTESRAALYLRRLTASVSGWAGHSRYLDWSDTQRGESADHTVAILAIRMAWEIVLLQAIPELGEQWRKYQENLEIRQTDAQVYARRLRKLAHDVLETHARNTLLDNAFRDPSNPIALPVEAATPDIHAVFCIDVRSERLRRIIECEDPGVRTSGFAGFFGLPIEVLSIDGADADAQCPVLLEPQFRVRESARTAEAASPLLQRPREQRQLGAAWRNFNRAAVSSFAYVESLGIAYAAKLASDLVRGAFGLKKKRHFAPSIQTLDSCGEATDLQLQQQVDLAESVLRGMSMTEQFAPLVALVGHGSTAVNNPYASRYHCGACGGHAGDANARLAAAILNYRVARSKPQARVIDVPETTAFVAALHDTATDEVTLLDTGLLPESSRAHVTKLQTLFDKAAMTVRLTRARDHGVMNDSAHDVLRRSQDWSEVRPEWGLVGCQAFIAAPRNATRHTDLHGRSFLHEYNWRRDDGFAVLELIMTAPLVVASWISLQYYASTVDNKRLGSGDKTLHNVVGGIGVLEGTGGDLRVGLPWQSVHDGERFLHKPERLSAVIAAPAEAITAILMKHDSVRELFDNQWLHLYALEDEGRIRQYVGDYRWKDTSSDVVQSLEHLPQTAEREAS